MTPTIRNGQIIPPWTEEQVEALNAYQNAKGFRPMICGLGPLHYRCPEMHILRATRDGWICSLCGTPSDKPAYEDMTKPELREQRDREIRERLKRLPSITQSEWDRIVGMRLLDPDADTLKAFNESLEQEKEGER